MDRDVKSLAQSPEMISRAFKKPRHFSKEQGSDPDVWSCGPRTCFAAARGSTRCVQFDLVTRPTSATLKQRLGRQLYFTFYFLF